jgi:putative ABC transport system permease protein
MFKYNLVLAFRSIKRNLSFSLINISGLSLGLTLVILLMSWLKFEFSFDKFHINADRIYRVFVEFNPGTASDNFGGTPAPLGELLKNTIPEVSDYVRFGGLGRTLVSFGKKQFWEEIDLADPSIFKIFSFKLLSGDPETSLKDPGSLILSESKARKYFGSLNPLGQTLLLGDEKRPYIITGVMNDVPANSQLQFNFLGSFKEMQGNLSWNNWNYWTYILANNDGAFNLISEKLTDIVKKIPSEERFYLHIQPLMRIHIHSRLRYDLPTNTDINTILIISSVLLLVLFVACVNYMNLATARYTRRGKEAGLRKVAGATNSNLAGQFLLESFAITFTAFIIAIYLSYLLFPFCISLTGIPLEIKSLFSFNSFVKFIILIIMISLISGSYPAFILSSVNPVSALRHDFKLGNAVSVKGLRRALVIFQFFVSIVLIACTLIIQYQMAFIRNKNLGLTPDQVVVVPIYQADVKSKHDLLKKEILTSPYILNASYVAYYPGNEYYQQNAWWEGIQEGDHSNMMSWLPVDPDFINTLKIELLRGENLPDHVPNNGPRPYLLNESAVKMTGWAEPLGKQFEICDIGKGFVAGIVRDFNYKSLHSGVEPVALTFYPDVFDNLMIKISAVNVPGTIDFLNKSWEKLFPQTPFEFSFLNDDFQKLYEKETMTLKMITAVSILSLFISCIGLFGLVLFTTDQRIKEIGLRKVAGSTSGGIIVMLNLQFIRWILISFFISCPIIIYFMQKWLESFAYRINLSWWIFASAVGISILISLMTVSWHTLYIASRNPVECLKHE